MGKKHLVIAIILYHALLMVGCSNSYTFLEYSEILHPIDETTAYFEDNEVIEETAQIALDYQRFLRMIWASGGMTVRFDKIENDVVVGHFENIRWLALPPVFDDYESHAHYVSNMTLVLLDEVAKGRIKQPNDGYWDIAIRFVGYDAIELIIEYATNLDEEFLHKPFEMLPLTLENPLMAGFIQDKDLPWETVDISLEIYLNSWGYVRFISGMHHGRAFFPGLFFSDLYGNLLYSFGDISATEIREIVKITVHDLNDNGLLDVKITLRATSGDLSYLIFYQLENGWFWVEPTSK